MSRSRFLILGPVVLARPDGTSVDIGGRNAKAILLSLLLDVGRAVPVDRIAFDVWGDDPPTSADQVIRSTISRLRHFLGPDRLEAVDHSYVLMIEPDRIDAVRFERFVDEAARLLSAGCPEPAAAACRSALQLWRGPPFGDLGSDPFAELEVHRLDELHARAVELHLEAEIALGDTGGVIGRLEAEAESHRYRERLWALLITALSRRRPAGGGHTRIRRCCRVPRRDRARTVRRTQGARRSSGARGLRGKGPPPLTAGQGQSTGRASTRSGGLAR